MIEAMRVAVLSIAFLLSLMIPRARAEDWPTWRGAARDGICRETSLLKQWPEGGPPLAWKASGLGGGFSGPAVVGTTLYTMGNLDGKECVVALDTRDGRRLWASPIGPIDYKGDHPGTRSTPTLDGDFLFAVGAGGRLACLKAKTGEVVWSKHFVSDFGGTMPRWGYAESPLIDGKRLLCLPGGDRGAVRALDPLTGETLWAADFKDLASYSSMIKASVGGVDQVVAFTFESVAGLDARTGKLLWRYKEPAHSADWGNVNVVTPVWSDGTVFASSNYGVGGGLARIVKAADGFRAEPVYFTKKLKNHHGGLVLVDGALYGCDDPGSLTCLDYKTGEVHWQSRETGKCSVLYADGMLYCRDEKGPLTLVEATPQAFRLRGRFDQPERSDKKAWPHPVIAHGRLYIRDQELLLCYDVKAKAAR
jgi:outer membrane protein assembly factor BamB